MKTLQPLFIALLFTFCLNLLAQTDPCANFAANFTISPASSGLTVQFTNLSTGSFGGGVNWTFGDGSQSTALSPAHTYAQSGAYTVCLVIENDLCNSETCKQIQVNAEGSVCNAQFNFETAGATAYFNANPSSANGAIVGWQWTFGDGTSSGADATAQTNHVYAAPGTYTVCLLIWTNNECEDDYCQTITIAGAPTPQCNAHFNFETVGSTAYFNANPSTANGTIIGWQWTFGDGTSSGSSGTAQTNHVYAAPGTYTVCLVIWTNNECEDDYCQTITIAGAPTPECNAHFNFETVGSTAYFNANPSTANGAIIGWQWTFGDGTSSGSSGTAQTNHVYAAPGTYNVCLIIWTNNECEDDYCHTVTIAGAPTPECNAHFNFETVGSTAYFNANPSTANGTIIGWQWTFGDGTSSGSSGTAQTNHVYAAPGTYNVCLIIWTNNECEDDYCHTVTIAGTPTPECNAHFNFEKDGLTVFFNGNPSTANAAITSWNWSFGDGTSANTGAQVSHVYTQSGSYTVCLVIETANGCEDDYCTNIIVTGSTTTPQCAAHFNFETVGLNLYLNGNPSESNGTITGWSWTFGDGTASPTPAGAQINHTYANGGTYEVCLTITTSNGCTDDYCHTITLTAPITPECNAQFVFETEGFTAAFNGSASTANADIVQWLWDFGNGNTANTPLATHVYSVAGTYNVCLTITTGNGCQHTTCQEVAIVSPAPQCNAMFIFETNGLIAYMSANPSTANGTIIGWQWNYGDGTGTGAAGTAQTTHTYSEAGTYNVCLTIWTANECENTYCTNITVTQPGGTPVCNANFNFETEGATLWVNGGISTANSDIAAWLWSFGNGATAETTAQTNYNYPSPGVYEVCLTIFTANGCQSTYCRSVTIENPASGNKLNLTGNLINGETLAAQVELLQAQVVKLYISDLTGKQVKVHESAMPSGINNIELFLGKQVPGVYFLSVVLEDGKKLTQRFYYVN